MNTTPATPPKANTDIIHLLSSAPAAAAGMMDAAKAKLESLKDLPREKAEELTSEVKDLALAVVDAAGATVAAIIACD